MVKKKISGAKTIPLQRCKPGEILAKDVHNPNGQKVVPGEKKLTPKILRRLSAAGIKRVTVYSEYSEEVEKTKKPGKKIEEEKLPENIIEETDSAIVVSGNLTRDLESDKDVTVAGNVSNNASITARGNVEIQGRITAGSVKSLEGSIDIKGPISGKNISLEAKKLIRAPSVEKAQLSVNGRFVVRGSVTDSNVDCTGNMVVHHKDVKASLVDSNLRVEGKLLADEIDAQNSSGCQLVFRDPKKRTLLRQKEAAIEDIEKLEKEFAKLKKIVETVQQLGAKVKQLDSEKKEKLRKHTQRFKKIRNELVKSQKNIENCEIKLEELQQERRYFMRVLNTLRQDTQITMENTMINIDEDEWNVKLYKKSMIVIQNAEDDELNEREWLLDS